MFKDSATQSWRISIARSQNELFNGQLGGIFGPQFKASLMQVSDERHAVFVNNRNQPLVGQRSTAVKYDE